MRRRPELAAVLLAALAAGCAAPAPTAAPAGSATPAVSSTPTLVPVHIVSSGNGSGSSVTVSEIKRRRKIYTIRARSFTADTAAGQSATGSGEFEQPHITFLDHSGAQTVADAPKAVLTSADKSVLMTGGVQARSQDGNVLSCDRLRYDGTTERIHGEGHVVLRTPTGLMLVGDEIDGDARLQNVRVYRR